MLVDRSGDWFYITPGVELERARGDERPAVIASELVQGALAPVKWEKACDGDATGDVLARFWRAVPPTTDYVALGAVGVGGYDASTYDQPPDELVARFRAVHKSALAAAEHGVESVRTSMFNPNCKIFGVDDKYWYADTVTLNKLDCKRLDPENVIWEASDKQFTKV